MKGEVYRSSETNNRTASNVDLLVLVASEHLLVLDSIAGWSNLKELHLVTEATRAESRHWQPKYVASQKLASVYLDIFLFCLRIDKVPEGSLRIYCVE
jgi:hypothetical protein